MSAIAAFVASYTSADRSKIDFAWNGKHAGDFVDENQPFRWEVVSYCIDEPGRASAELLEHLFLADAAWTREAWGSPEHFGALAATLLQRGGEAALDAFATGLSASFDTFGACHRMRISPDLAARLAIAARDKSDAATDDKLQKHLLSTSELFIKLQKGTASEGWATVAPETPVYAVRVVGRRWHHTLWLKLSEWVRRRAT
jgi:hypothetical protein